jgi:hypothetical protein
VFPILIRAAAAALLIVSLGQGPAFADAPKLKNTCAGITLRGWEFIEPQGAFGLATPKADGQLVTDGFLQALAMPGSVVQRYCDLLQKAYMAKYHLGPLLELVLVCDADTQPERKRYRSAPRVLMECHLAYNHCFKRSPDFFDLRRYSIAEAPSWQDVVGCENRHDLLDDPAVRRRLYMKAFEDLAREEVDREDRGLGVNLEPYYQHYRNTW